MYVLANESLMHELGDLNETRKAVENAENRARLNHKKIDLKTPRKHNREYAQALHREADQLYRSGDYETALILYHRAANLYPKDSSHGVAARRTAATISSCNNAKSLHKVLSTSNPGEQLTAALCPETAAIIASEKLKKLPEPSCVTEVLSYFDNHKTYWKHMPSARISKGKLAGCNMTIKHLKEFAESLLKDLQNTFDLGKIPAALKIAQELLVLSSGFQDPTRYQISAYHYLSLIHVALGRHDRAVCNVSRLVRLSKSTEDVVEICRSLVTLGKVHLSFGHLEAAAKAWEHLSRQLKAPIPVAWIRHEIGRCYLETGKYVRAMELASKCIEAASRCNSQKWILNGKLLLGQSLAKQGRFAESLEELQIAGKLTEVEGDGPLLLYVHDLMCQVARALNWIPYEHTSWETTQSNICAGQQDEVEDHRLFIKRETAIVTTVYSQRMMSKERLDESGDDKLLDTSREQVTIHSNKRISLAETCCRNIETDEKKQLVEGSSTFRVEALAIDKNEPSISSSSSSSSSVSTPCDYEEEGEEINAEAISNRTWICASKKSEGKREEKKEERNEEEEDEEEEESEGQEEEVEGEEEVEVEVEEEEEEVDEEEEVGMQQESDSKTSLKSTDTVATYIIEDGSIFGQKAAFKGSIDNEEKDRPNKINTEAVMESIVYGDGMNPENEAMLQVFKALESLKDKDEVELLETLRNMLLNTDKTDRLGECGDFGDGFRTTRSSGDRKSEISTRRQSSLPSSARNFNVYGDC